MSPRSFGSLLVAASLVLAGRAQAFEYLRTAQGKAASFSQREVTFRLPARLPDGLTDEEVQAAAEHALARWSQASGLVLRLERDVEDPVTGCQADRAGNHIVFVKRDWKQRKGAVAETLVCMGQDSGRIHRADILLNAADFRFRALPPGHAKGGIYYDLESVLTHELGHALGLAHSDVSEAAMFPQGERGDTSKRELALDDVEGVQSLYVALAGADDPAAGMGCSSVPGSSCPWALLALLSLLRRSRSPAAR